MTPRVRIDAIPEGAEHEQIREIVRRTRRTDVYKRQKRHSVGTAPSELLGGESPQISVTCDARQCPAEAKAVRQIYIRHESALSTQALPHSPQEAA